MIFIKEKKDRKEIFKGNERSLGQDKFQGRELFDGDGLLNLQQREVLYTRR